MQVTDRTLGRAARQLVELASIDRAPAAAARARAGLEHLLLRIVTRGGPRALERVVRAARLRGLALQPDRETRVPGMRAWQVAVPSRNALLGVRGFSSRAFRYVSISWRTRPAPPKLPTAQKRRHRQQQAFYARYTAAGRRAYASPPRRIGALDRSILLIGELEADVNNGGFAQYLDNKGRRRAGEALQALRRIGARATAGLLEAALRPDLPRAARDRLDDRFDRGREDLAYLAARAFHLMDGS
jgi:hypothetical protein